MKKTRLLMAALACLCWRQAHAEDFDLVLPVWLETMPTQAAGIGDITQDSLGDVVGLSLPTPSSAGNGMLRVYVQQPDKTLPRLIEKSVFQPTGAMKLADIDNNGFPEILAGTQSGVDLYLWNSAYSSLYLQSVPTGMPCVHLETVDLDADGYRDIVCQNDVDGVVVALNQGDHGAGAFVVQPVQADIGLGGWDINLGDVTGDGRVDLVVTAPADAASAVMVHPGNGQGKFGTGIAHAAPDNWAYWTNAVGDFNSDGAVDVAVGYGSTTNAIHVYEQHAGELADTAPIATSGRAQSLLAYDIDRDGDQDLLVSTTMVGWYLQGQDGFDTPEILREVLGSATSYSMDRLAAGDLDDDACTDVAVATGSMGLMVLHGRDCVKPKAVNDFDGDGASDLLWHNGSTGASTWWWSAMMAVPYPLTTVGNPQWSIVGTGDFNGDRLADVLWRNDATGAGVIWKNSSFGSQQNITRVTNPAWRIVGIGDFDGDGKDDLLWRDVVTGNNAIWRSGNFASQMPITAVTNVAWEVVGIGDFDADGKDDIVWRHATLGQNAIWGAGDYRRQIPVATVASRAWRVAGVGDFDGDGHADLLWRNQADGSNVIWRSANVAYNDHGILPTRALDWNVAGVGDFDGNGRDDILWRQSSTARTEYWRGADATLSRPVVSAISEAWQIIK